MEEKQIEYSLIDNEKSQQFEFRIGERVAKIDYIIAKERIYLTHTEVPRELEGRGIASQLVLKTLREIESRNLTLVPMCPFVATYIKRHPEWKSLVLKGVNVG